MTDAQGDSVGMQMNAHFEMDSADVMRVKLEVLRREHRDLDEAIHAVETGGRGTS